MDDPEGGLSFDFEGNLDSSALPSAAPSAANLSSALSTAAPVPSSGADPSSIPPGGGGRRGSFRQTVCRHWLRGLCMKGDLCGFLHQYDKARMPICRFFRLYGECREQDCVYKHSEEDFKECNMYAFSFFDLYILITSNCLKVFKILRLLFGSILEKDWIRSYSSI
jgi:cleavage and polyadenylation specificity factor subunit 4